MRCSSIRCRHVRLGKTFVNAVNLFDPTKKKQKLHDPKKKENNQVKQQHRNYTDFLETSPLNSPHFRSLCCIFFDVSSGNCVTLRRGYIIHFQSSLSCRLGSHEKRRTLVSHFSEKRQLVYGIPLFCREMKYVDFEPDVCIHLEMKLDSSIWVFSRKNSA